MLQIIDMPRKERGEGEEEREGERGGEREEGRRERGKKGNEG